MKGGLQLSSVSKARPAVAATELEAQAQVALRRLGFDGFRGRQLEAIVAALSGRDSFVLMPTGGGKSLCYGLVPAVRPGLAVVISPLIALMEDQAFRAKGLRADFLSSARPEADRQRLLDDVRRAAPGTQLLFVTPESLGGEAVMGALRAAYASGALLLAAVDEAHCISSWGHDFRSSYRNLGVLRRELPRLPIMALTATASERVQADIVRSLALRDPLLLRASFNRPEICYEVRYLDAMRDRSNQLLTSPLPDILAMLERSGGGTGGSAAPAQPAGRPERRCPCAIIYCHRREDADSVSTALLRRGFRAAAYHAGLPDAVRSRVLAEWRARRLDVVAATVAFGMGVDRADVRTVIHYSLPKSLEAFYQEAGRAGRDGQPSRSLVYYSVQDRQRLEYVLSKGEEEQAERRAQRRGGQQQPGSGGGGERPRQVVQFGQVVDYCLKPCCRRAAVLAHFGERPPAGAAGGPACCDVCSDRAAVGAALRDISTQGAQRQQRFAGGKHTLDFGGGGGGGGGRVPYGGARGGVYGAALEFENSRPSEGLDYDEDGKRPSRVLGGEEEEDAIEGGSSDEEEGEAAAAAMARARRAAHGSPARLLAAMEREEQRHEADAAGGSKRARLLHKLEGGGGGGGSRGAAAPAGGSSSSVLTAEQRQGGARQLAAVLEGNEALAAAVGSASAAQALAGALERQLVPPGASRPVYLSKLSSLALQLRKAAAVPDVPALQALLASAEGRAAAAAAALAVLTPDVLLQRVAAAVRLAAAAAPPPGASGPTAVQQAEAVAAAAAALQQLESAPVTAELLAITGAGKAVHKLRKHGCAAVAAAAAATVSAWKARLGA